MDLDYATATDLIRAMRDRELSSRELLGHILARVEHRNPRLNAIVALDADRAWAAAAAADAATARGEARGPLHGLPMSVKDVWETAGLVTTSGAAELTEYVPAADALAVGRLKAAGAIVFGKSNTPLYAGDSQTFNDVYGLTSNPVGRYPHRRRVVGRRGGRGRRRAYAAGARQ
jgi:amidase